MTYRELLKTALQQTVDEESDEVLKLMAFAYYAGREQSAKNICDKARAIFAEQRERARQCRYHQMAEQIIGKQTHIYSPDYSGDYTMTFGDDVVPEELSLKVQAKEKND